MKVNLRLLYLYLFAFVGLLIVTIGSIRMVELGMKVLVFKDADKYEMYPTKDPDGAVIDLVEQKRQQDRELVRQRQREFSGSLAMIAVGLPLYLYHWKTIQKEQASAKED